MPPLQIEACNLKFGLSVFASMKRGAPAAASNTLLSPLSLSTALSMTAMGAGGQTATQMWEVLSCPAAASAMVPALYHDLFGRLQAAAASSKVKLRVANGLCIVSGDVRPAFKEMLRNQFDAEVFEGAEDRVNQWVSAKTEGRIPTLLEKLPKDTVCVLLNAIYFNAKWERPFESHATYPTPFHLADGSTTSVQLMQQTASFRLLEAKDFQALEMPYTGGALSFVVLLPRSPTGLDELERRLSGDMMTDLMSTLLSAGPRKLRLSIPRFRIEASMSMKPTMQDLGMRDAFSPAADFGGIGPALYISEILHKTFIAVGELGTEAAAATAVVMSKGFSMPPPLEFCADHPFAFLIIDAKSRTPLFLGALRVPLSEPAVDDVSTTAKTQGKS